MGFALHKNSSITIFITAIIISTGTCNIYKGTNVKDAYDATVAVMSAFGGSRNCSYMVSTHITEAGSALAEKSEHFRFMYLPTVMKGKVPTYTYRLAEGISSDRHGMMMVANERIVEIITGK